MYTPSWKEKWSAPPSFLRFLWYCLSVVDSWKSSRWEEVEWKAYEVFFAEFALIYSHHNKSPAHAHNNHHGAMVMALEKNREIA